MNTPENAKSQLMDIIRERSFKSGVEIKLASGRTSSYYFNLKPTMMTAQGAFLISTLTLDLIEGDNADYLGGLEMGAVPLAASIAATSSVQQRPIATFFVRKQTKEHGTQQLIEGLAPGETLTGKNIIIMEDVTTTGGSAVKAAKMVQDTGANIMRVVTVVDRQEGAEEAFADAGLLFSSLLTKADFK